MVKNYKVYTKTKTLQYKLYKELQTLLILEQTQDSVTINFIIKLFKFKDLVNNINYNNIFVIIKHLSKYNKFIPVCNAPCQRVTDRRRWYVVICCCHRVWCTRYVYNDKLSNNDNRIVLKPGRHNGMPASLSNLYSLGFLAIGCILSHSCANFSSCFLTARYKR